MKSQTIPVTEAAQRLGISRKSAYKAANRGELPGAFRVGGRILVKKRVLEDFLRHDRREPERVEHRGD